MKTKMKIITGAVVVTMNIERQIIPDGAVVINGDKIAKIGSTEAILSAYSDQEFERINANGKVLLPGFVNIHTHAGLTVLRGVGDEWATFPSYTKSIPQGVLLSPDDIYLFSLLGGLEALRFGSTTIVDNYIYSNENVKAFENLKMRTVISERIHDADLFKIPSGEFLFSTDIGDHFIEKNIELIETWHGANNGLIQCRMGPHAPDTCSMEYLERVRSLADQYKVGIVIHLAQGAYEGKVIKERTGGLSPVQYLDKAGLLGPDLIAAHCIYLDQADIQLMADRNINVAHMPEGNAKYGMIAPIAELRQAGVNVGLGTDNMAADMIEVMRFAVLIGRTRNHEAWYPSSLDALEMATINGAKALGMQDQIGSIEEGKKADIILIDFRKPHLLPVIEPIPNLIHTGLGSDVDTVIVNGEVLVDEGKVVVVDEEKILQDVQALAKLRWSEIGKREIAFDPFPQTIK
jgi:5-methylthioadenosine/S-adenosylhomocysteine deaminase